MLILMSPSDTSLAYLANCLRPSPRNNMSLGKVLATSISTARAGALAKASEADKAARAKNCFMSHSVDGRARGPALLFPRAGHGERRGRSACGNSAFSGTPSAGDLLAAPASVEPKRMILMVGVNPPEWQ